MRMATGSEPVAILVQSAVPGRFVGSGRQGATVVEVVVVVASVVGA